MAYGLVLERQELDEVVEAGVLDSIELLNTTPNPDTVLIQYASHDRVYEPPQCLCPYEQSAMSQIPLSVKQESTLGPDVVELLNTTPNPDTVLIQWASHDRLLIFLGDKTIIRNIKLPQLGDLMGYIG